MDPNLQVRGDLYNRIFTSKMLESDIWVDYQVWNQLFAALPDDYKVPDMTVLAFLSTF